MTKNLSLQYITSANPSLSEIKNSLVQLEANRKLEEPKIEQVIQLASQPRMTVDQKTLWILEYKLMVEETLIEHPQFCGLATSLEKLSSNLHAHKNLALLGVSLAAAPLIAVIAPGALLGAATADLAVGGLTSIYYLKDSYSNLQNAKQAARIGPDGESSINSQWAIDNAESDLQSDIVTTPLMFLGLPAKQLAKTAESTLKTSAEIFQKVGASRTKVKVLPKQNR